MAEGHLSPELLGSYSSDYPPYLPTPLCSQSPRPQGGLHTWGHYHSLRCPRHKPYQVCPCISGESFLKTIKLFNSLLFGSGRSHISTEQAKMQGRKQRDGLEELVELFLLRPASFTWARIQMLSPEITAIFSSASWTRATSTGKPVYRGSPGSWGWAGGLTCLSQLSSNPTLLSVIPSLPCAMVCNAITFGVQIWD